MKPYTFQFQKIETRTSRTEEKKPEFIVRGYAAVPDVAYGYQYNIDSKGRPIKSLKEIFSQTGIENLAKKLESRKIFVDAEHEIGNIINTKHILKNIAEKTGTDIQEEAKAIIENIKHSDIPLAKITDFKVEDRGLYVEAKLNPDYQLIDENHKNYFDAVWGSLQNKFLNGISINFIPTDVSKFSTDNDIIPQINDVDIYGISFTGQPSNEYANITEVFMRSAREKIEVDTMEQQNQEKKLIEEKEAQLREAQEKLRQMEETLKQKELATQKKDHDDMLQNMQRDLEEQKKQNETNKKIIQELQNTQNSSAKGIVAPMDKYGNIQNDDQWAENIRKNIDDISKEPLGFAKLLSLQGEFNANRTLPPETLALLGKSSNDIVISKAG